LPSNFSDNDLQMLVPAAIRSRIIRDRGFGFVEFSSAQDAEIFMNNSGHLRVQGRPLTMDYSNNREESGHGGGSGGKQDWVCGIGNCPGYNFARRKSCIQCGQERDDRSLASPGTCVTPHTAHRHTITQVRADRHGGPARVLQHRSWWGTHEARRIRFTRPHQSARGARPTSRQHRRVSWEFLWAVGAVTRGSTRLACMAQPGSTTSHSNTQQVRLLRDKLTGQSRGFAFVEFGR
jgi:hypothetical protein